jgi:hypothetical protein
MHYKAVLVVGIGTISIVESRLNNARCRFNNSNRWRRRKRRDVGVS